MSIWSDIEDKNSRETISKEEFNIVYPGKDSVEQDHELSTGEYEKMKYTIYTNGQYPYISISTDLNISSKFSGCGLIKIDINNKTYDIQRITKGSGVYFVYFCNQETDYIDGEHDGKKYTVSLLHTMAEKIIDSIIQSERSWENELMKKPE